MPLHCVLVVSRGQDAVSTWIEDNLEGGKVVKKQSMGGSGWSSAAVLTTENGQKYFAKESKGKGIQMFLGEAKGLKAMHGAPSLVALFLDLKSKRVHSLNVILFHQMQHN